MPSREAGLVPVETELSQVSGNLKHNGEIGVISLNQMPKLDKYSVYQLWLRHGDKITASTIFTVGKNKQAAVAISDGLLKSDQVMITKEPRGGSSSPTGQVLASFTI